jgi:hypothetical protein
VALRASLDALARRKKSLPFSLPDSNFSPSAHSVVTILTELLRLLWLFGASNLNV